MEKSLQQTNTNSISFKNQSLLGSFKNMLTRDLNKISKKLPLPPILQPKKKKEFDRPKFIKFLEKKQKYYAKLIYELNDPFKLEKCRILLSSLNLMLFNIDNVNDDEILEMYSDIKKGIN